MQEDPWNAIASGALTGGFLQLRHGMASAGRSAVFGGVLLAGIEGIGIMITRLTAPPPPPMLDDMLMQSPAGLAKTAAPAASTAPPDMPAGLESAGFSLEGSGDSGLLSSSSPSAAPAGGKAASGGGWLSGLWGGGDGGAARKAAQPPMSTEQPPMPDFGSSSSGGGGNTFR